MYEGQTWKDIEAWRADNTKMPRFIRKIYGGKEQCPTTGRVHLQLAFNTQHIRDTQMRALLPGVHVQAARNKDDVVRYCMKLDTAAGEKTVVENGTPYYTCDMLCLELAKHWPTEEQALEYKYKKTDDIYWHCVRAIVDDKPQLMGNFLNAQLRTAWCKTSAIWRKKAQAQGL